MTIRLERQSLSGQLCSVLREGIARGEWREWLPGERDLCASLQVSRNSLRAALQQLAREGLLRNEAGRGWYLVKTPAISTHASEAGGVVNLLCPEPLSRLRPRQALWIDELRALLAANGRLLKIHHSPQYFRGNPARALQRLVSQQESSCWILVLAGAGCQRWFERHGVPCIVAGSCHEGVNLPSVDIDYRAMCRHAAATMIRLGHRRVALLNSAQGHAGDVASEIGFAEGVARSGCADAESIVVRHAVDSVESVQRSLRRVMASSAPPTAFLVTNSYFYLTVASVLGELGWAIPRDVSVISRDDDTFLSYMVPEPARYVEDPIQFARKVQRMAQRLSQGEITTGRETRLIPRFVMGKSLGAPRT